MLDELLEFFFVAAIREADDRGWFNDRNRTRHDALIVIATYEGSL